MVKRMRTGGLLGPSEGKTGVNYVMKGQEEQTEGSSPNQEVGEFQGQSWVCPGSAQAPPLPVGALGQVPLPLNTSREWDDEPYYEGLPKMETRSNPQGIR